MYIRNKKTGLVQECHNKDVIRICRKDSEHFEVFGKNPNAESGIPSGTKDDEESGTGQEAVLSEMGVKELRAVAKEKGIDGASALNKEELLEVLKDVM